MPIAEKNPLLSASEVVDTKLKPAGSSEKTTNVAKPKSLRVSGDISLSDVAIDVTDKDEPLSPSKRYNLRSAGLSGIRAVLGHPVDHVSGDISLADASLTGESYHPSESSPVLASSATITKKSNVDIGLEKQKKSNEIQKATSAQAGKSKIAAGIATAATAVGNVSQKSSSVSPTRQTAKRGAEVLTSGLTSLEETAAAGLDYAKHAAVDSYDFAKHRLEDGLKFAKQKTGLGVDDVQQRTGQIVKEAQALKKDAAVKVDNLKATVLEKPNPIADYLAAGSKSTADRAGSKSPTKSPTKVNIPSMTGSRVGVGANMPDEEVMTL